MSTVENKYELSGFTAIRNEIFQANLNPSEFKILLFLHSLDYWRQKDRSYSFIAKGVNLHEKTVFRVIASLAQKEFIQKVTETKNGKYLSNKYKLLRSFLHKEIAGNDKKSLHSPDKKPGNKTKKNKITESDFQPPGQGPGGGGDAGYLSALLAISKEVGNE